MRALILVPLVVLLYAPCADACAGCASAPYQPKGPLPANLLALPSRGMTQLLDADGGALAFDMVPDGVLPTRPLNAGETLTLDTGFSCPGTPTQTPLTIGPSAPLPTIAGTLVISARSGNYWTPSSSGFCDDEIKADGVTVSLDPDEALKPWLDLTKTIIVVDNRTWNSSLQWGLHPRFDVYGACGGVPEGADPGLSHGSHHGELRVHVAGATGDLPALPFEVKIECVTGGCGCRHASPLLSLAALLLLRRRASR